MQTKKTPLISVVNDAIMDLVGRYMDSAWCGTTMEKQKVCVLYLRKKMQMYNAKIDSVVRW
jgi:hypothetical protein